MAKVTVNPLCGWLPGRLCAVLMVWRGLRADSCQKALASKGIWAVHSGHSFLSSRDLKQNWFLSPPPTARILSCMCTVAQRCLYFKIIGHLCQTQWASTISGLQLCLSPEEERDCHSSASAARGWTVLKGSPAWLATLLLPSII